MKPALRRVLLSGKTVAFSDDFERTDTLDGAIGSDWDLRGPYAGSYPLPASLYGRITNGRFVADVNQFVYAVKLMPQNVRRLTCDVSWTPNGGATALGTAALIISPNSKIIDTMLHITVSRGGANIQKRIAGGAFVTMTSLTFSPSLVNGGVIHGIKLDVVGNNSAVLTVDGMTCRITDADIPLLLGPYICFEIAQSSADMVDLVRFENVKIWR